MTCPICKKETNVICTCGFCPKCIKEYGHEGCHDIIDKRKHKEKENE